MDIKDKKLFFLVMQIVRVLNLNEIIEVSSEFFHCIFVKLPKVKNYGEFCFLIIYGKTKLSFEKMQEF